MPADEPHSSLRCAPRATLQAFAAVGFMAALGTLLGPLAAPSPAVEEAAALPADGPADAAVRLVPIRLPLVGADDQLIKGTLQRAVDQLKELPTPATGRPTLVIEFVLDPAAARPDGRGSEFERALALARFLSSSEMAGIKTIAFLPQTVKGHAVLVAMACEEIAMAPDAEIGEAAIDEAADRPIEPSIVSFYREIAESRGTVPPAIAAGWVDRQAEVFRVESEDRTDLVTRDQLAGIEAERTIVNQDLLVPAGALGLSTGRAGRELGFVDYFAKDREGLARVLGVPPVTLDESRLLLDEWKPVLIDVEGGIGPKEVERASTMIGEEVNERGANWIGFRIDSGGGDLEACVNLATIIAELDSREVRTVAYVPAEARGGAALVALACDQLVMHPTAKLTGIEPPPAPDDRRKLGPKDGDRDQPQDVSDDTDAAVLVITESLANNTNHSASLLSAMIDPRVRVYRYTNKQTAAVRFFSEQEVAAQPDTEAWRRGEELTAPGKLLVVSAERAEQLGVAWRVVETFDDLARLYGFEATPRVAKVNWANEFVRSLASPQLAMLLLMFGFIGIYVELNMPGIGVGGFIATVAFVLFFWSKFTAGTANWLVVMLFVTGLLCLLLELLVLPGTGIFGFGGAVLMLASIILAGQSGGVLPKTESQLQELRTSLATVAGAMAGMIVVGIVLRRYLPHTPLFRRMQLAPAEGADRIELETREAVADYAHLVGMVGAATTDLLPSGKAEIDGEIVDVIADGGVIDRGTSVRVVSAKANRVLVRAVR